MTGLTFGQILTVASFYSTAKVVGMTVKVEKKPEVFIPEHMKGMIWASNTGVKHHPVWRLEGVKIIHKMDDLPFAHSLTYYTMS
jgi:hypothetical protein